VGTIQCICIHIRKKNKSSWERRSRQKCWVLAAKPARMGLEAKHTGEIESITPGGGVKVVSKG
jgi:hypothetical protein